MRLSEPDIDNGNENYYHDDDDDDDGDDCLRIECNCGSLCLRRPPYIAPVFTSTHSHDDDDDDGVCDVDVVSDDHDLFW